MTTPGGVQLLWPVGEPAAERIGTGLPSRWAISIGYDQEYWLSPAGGTRTRAVHPGLDLSRAGDERGDRVYSVADGVVVYAAPAPGSWGNVVMVHHPELGLWSQYAHLASLPVVPGQQVYQGTVVGTVGDAGGRFAPHLHFELRREDLSAAFWPSAGGRTLAAAHELVQRAYVDPYGLLGR